MTIGGLLGLVYLKIGKISLSWCDAHLLQAVQKVIRTDIVIEYFLHFNDDNLLLILVIDLVIVSVHLFMAIVFFMEIGGSYPVPT